MKADELLTPGMSAGAVALVFMFKMYIDKKKNGHKGNGNSAVEEIKRFREEMNDRERREEMKPLAEAINRLTVAIKEMHASHQMQVEILKTISNRMIQGG